MDLAVECERHLIVLVVHARPGIDPDIESLVSHLKERDRVGLLSRGDDFVVHFQDTAASLGNPRTVIGVFESNRVLAWHKHIRSLPSILGEDQHIVVEYRFALEHVETPAAPAPAHGGDHAVAATLWNIDLGGHFVGSAEN